MPFLAAAIAALVMMPLAARLASSLGLVDRPAGDLKIHADPIPVVGGAVVVVSIATSLLVGPRYPAAVMGAVGLALLVGLVDDLRPTAPWVRMLSLGGVGLMFVAGGLELEAFGPLAVPATLVLVLACANAVNMMDGQDGLAGGLAALASVALAGIGASNGDAAATTLGLATAGALTGFLVFNISPARIYLGNGGAYAVGALLAVLAASVVANSGWRGVLAAGLCLGVFALELAYTVARRIRHRTSVATGDRSHSYDRLARRIGRSRATAAFWALGALAGGLGLAADRLGLAAGIVIGLIVLAAALVAALSDLGFGWARLRRLP